jgi:hypothetical protein
MKRIAHVLAPLASLAAAVAAAAVSVALLSAQPAQARGLDSIQTDFARAVYLSSAAQVHNEAPQPLLRAVVVLRIRLDEHDQWQAEVFRDNPSQPGLTRAALQSITRLPPPLGLSARAQQVLHGDGLLEAWLFQDDGRFALKSLARPQRPA